MLTLHHKRRWVLSPLRSDGTPLAAEYAVACSYHLAHDGKALAFCEFNAHGLAAARACPELIVWPSLHSGEAVHDQVADHYSGHGLKRGMSHYEALHALAVHHPSFEPEV